MHLSWNLTQVEFGQFYPRVAISIDDFYLWEPLTTHVVVGVLQWGADRPQPWRDPVARAVWRDLPILRATVWSGGAGRHLPGALPWLRDYRDASPPPAELRGALESLYSKPRHHFLVAARPWGGAQ